MGFKMNIIRTLEAKGLFEEARYVEELQEEIKFLTNEGAETSEMVVDVSKENGQLKARNKKLVTNMSEAKRLLGKVVPNNQNDMIVWAVNSGDSVYTNAGAAYRVLLEALNSVTEKRR